jgi:hypothetical protein
LIEKFRSIYDAGFNLHIVTYAPNIQLYTKVEQNFMKTYLTKLVLPVPGGPYSKTPRTGCVSTERFEIISLS